MEQHIVYPLGHLLSQPPNAFESMKCSDLGKLTTYWQTDPIELLGGNIGNPRCLAKIGN